MNFDQREHKLPSGRSGVEIFARRDGMGVSRLSWQAVCAGCSGSLTSSSAALGGGTGDGVAARGCNAKHSPT
jgi:hypothetical protein